MFGVILNCANVDSDTIKIQITLMWTFSDANASNWKLIKISSDLIKIFLLLTNYGIKKRVISENWGIFVNGFDCHCQCGFTKSIVWVFKLDRRKHLIVLLFSNVSELINLRLLMCTMLWSVKWFIRQWLSEYLVCHLKSTHLITVVNITIVFYISQSATISSMFCSCHTFI